MEKKRQGKMCVFIHNGCVMHFFCTPICTLCPLILNQGELIGAELTTCSSLHYRPWQENNKNVYQ